MCNACGIAKDVVDKDHSKGKFIVNLQWGQLMMHGSRGTEFLDQFDHYVILMVDDYGQKMGSQPVAGIAGNIKRDRDACCNPAEYSLQVAGMWPAGATKFMIVPANADVNGTEGYALPMGAMTYKFTDSAQGPATRIIKGSIVMQIENSAEFIKSPHAVPIMQKSIADSVKGIEEEHVLITAISIVARRLGGRGLADGVKVEYQIILPATSSVQVTKGSIDVDKLAAAVTANAKERGLTVEINGQPVVSKVTTETVGEETATGAASPIARSALTALVTAIAAVILA